MAAGSHPAYSFLNDSSFKHELRKTKSDNIVMKDLFMAKK
jgi:hypothetical protein